MSVELTSGFENIFNGPVLRRAHWKLMKQV